MRVGVTALFVRLTSSCMSAHARFALAWGLHSTNYDTNNMMHNTTGNREQQAQQAQAAQAHYYFVGLGPGPVCTGNTDTGMSTALAEAAARVASVSAITYATQ